MKDPKNEKELQEYLIKKNKLVEEDWRQRRQDYLKKLMGIKRRREEAVGPGSGKIKYDKPDSPDEYQLIKKMEHEMGPGSAASIADPGTDAISFSPPSAAPTVAPPTPAPTVKDVTSEYCLKFDGSDEYLVVDKDTATGLDFNSTDSFTIMAWVRCEMYDTGTIICRGRDSSSDYQYYLYVTGWSDNPYFSFILGDQQFYIRNYGMLVDGEFHQIVVSQPTGDRVYFYVDGVLAGHGAVPGADVAVDRDVLIGARWDADGLSSGNEFEGWISELAVWNGSALTRDEVREIYQNSSADFDLTANSGDYASSSNLVSWWKMGDGTEAASGTTVYNMAGTGDGYNAIAQNMEASDYQGIGKCGPNPGITGTSTKCVNLLQYTGAETTDASSPVNQLDILDDYSAVIWVRLQGGGRYDNWSTVSPQLFTSYDGRVMELDASSPLFRMELKRYFTYGYRYYYKLTVGNKNDYYKYSSIPYGQWVMLSFAYDGSADKVADMYINGNWVAQTDAVTTTSVTGKDDFNISLGTYGAALVVDWTAVWDKKLTAKEMFALYNGGEPWDYSTNKSSYESKDNLIAFYKFEEGEGTSVADDSINDYPLTITRSNPRITAEWMTRAGQVSINKHALVLNGVDEYLLLDKDTAVGMNFDDGDDFTIAIWARIPNNKSGWLICRGLQTTGTNVQWGVYVAGASDDGPNIQLKVGSETLSTVGGNWLRDGSNHQIVLTHTSSRTRLYVDGHLAETTNEGGDAEAVDRNIVFGAAYDNAGGGTDFLNCGISEIMIWDTDLTSNNIAYFYGQGIYNRGLPMDPTAGWGHYDKSADLQAWWKFGDGTEAASGTTVYDMTGESGNNLTAYNIADSNYYKIGLRGPSPAIPGYRCYAWEYTSSTLARVTKFWDGYRDFSAFYDYDADTTFSFMMWWLPKGGSYPTTSDHVIFGRVDGNDYSNTAMQYGFRYDYDSGNSMPKIQAWVGDQYTETDTWWMPLDQWYQLVLTYDTSDDKVKLYINGTYISQAASASSTVSMATTDTFSHYMRYGMIGPFAVWNTALTTDEVWAVYNYGTPFDLRNDAADYTSSANLKAYMMCDGTGQYIEDKMGPVRNAAMWIDSNNLYENAYRWPVEST